VAKNIGFFFSLLTGVMWALCFKIIDPTATAFQLFVIGLLTAIVFVLGSERE
jgi:hypothetical protein